MPNCFIGVTWRWQILLNLVGDVMEFSASIIRTKDSSPQQKIMHLITSRLMQQLQFDSGMWGDGMGGLTLQPLLSFTVWNQFQVGLQKNKVRAQGQLEDQPSFILGWSFCGHADCILRSVFAHGSVYSELKGATGLFYCFRSTQRLTWIWLQ